MEAGAAGFVVKDTPAAQLAQMVRRVAAGHRVVDPALAAKLLSGLVNSIVEWYRPGRPGTATLPEDVVRAALTGIVPSP